MTEIPLLEIFLRLAAALVAGGIIGYERERDSQPAGLRTHMILALGAALVMILSVNIGIKYGSDPSRLAAQVVSGIGFLGAGAILQVIVEVGAFLLAQHPDRRNGWLSPAVVGGLIAGLGFMYATAAFIKI